MLLTAYNLAYSKPQPKACLVQGKVVLCMSWK